MGRKEGALHDPAARVIRAETRKHVPAPPEDGRMSDCREVRKEIAQLFTEQLSIEVPTEDTDLLDGVSSIR